MSDYPFETEPTPEELAKRQEAERLRLAVQREVIRIQSGEAEEEVESIRENMQQEKQAVNQAIDEEIEREQRRHMGRFMSIMSGKVLREIIAKNYRYLAVIAISFFVSTTVMFMAFYQDEYYNRLSQESQMLREKAIQLQTQRFNETSHSSIIKRLKERGILLYDPITPKIIIED